MNILTRLFNRLRQPKPLSLQRKGGEPVYISLNPAIMRAINRAK